MFLSQATDAMMIGNKNEEFVPFLPRIHTEEYIECSLCTSMRAIPAEPLSLDSLMFLASPENSIYHAQKSLLPRTVTLILKRKKKKF